MAWTMLTADNVPVVVKDVGGTRGRRLLFNVDDGSALGTEAITVP
jgi:chemotaxis receptor (MCP) glutamine deamidase CheD